MKTEDRVKRLIRGCNNPQRTNYDGYWKNGKKHSANIAAPKHVKHLCIVCFETEIFWPFTHKKCNPCFEFQEDMKKVME